MASSQHNNTTEIVRIQIRYRINEDGVTATVLGIVDRDYKGELKIAEKIYHDGNFYKVAHIEKNAFNNCEGLTGPLTLPKSLLSIGENAFKGCKGLETITIHDGVEYIGEYAFFDCTDLKSIVIPASVEEIDDNAFEGCTNLTDVIIEGHPEMGNNVFKDCPNLKSKFKRKPTFRDRSNH